MVRQTTVSLFACLLAAAAGCKDDSASTYGMKPGSSSSSSSMMATPSATAAPTTGVPAGARKLSEGTYNQIQFTVPEGGGSIFVYDLDSQKVVGMTNAVAANANQSMTMTDLKNTSQGLNMTDHYQIYLAPTHATTQPIGSSSGM